MTVTGLRKLLQCAELDGWGPLEVRVLIPESPLSVDFDHLEVVSDLRGNLVLILEKQEEEDNCGYE